jgi:hypothetical protein
MKKEKITQEIREKLREPFPKKALKKHPTKPYLVTIKAAYVYERLNNHLIEKQLRVLNSIRQCQKYY